jgi:hypothetical protein
MAVTMSTGRRGKGDNVLATTKQRRFVIYGSKLEPSIGQGKGGGEDEKVGHRGKKRKKRARDFFFCGTTASLFSVLSRGGK